MIEFYFGWSFSFVGRTSRWIPRSGTKIGINPTDDGGIFFRNARVGSRTHTIQTSEARRARCEVHDPFSPEPPILVDSNHSNFLDTFDPNKKWNSKNMEFVGSKNLCHDDRIKELNCLLHMQKKSIFSLVSSSRETTTTKYH